MELIDACSKHGIKKVLQLPSVKKREALYHEHEEKFIFQIHRSTSIFRNLMVLNLQNEEVIFAGNRFMIYALFPQCNLSVHVLPGHNKASTVFAMGKSIVNKTSEVNIGELMVVQGGGGHRNAGTCQVTNDTAPDVLNELILSVIKHAESRYYVA